MRRRTRWLSIAVAAWLGGCATSATTGPFAQVTRIEPELRRGVSTKADVEKLLGKPRGHGATLLPGSPAIRTVWSYEDASVRNLRNATKPDVVTPRVSAGEPPLLLGDLNHQLLLVIFDGEVLDGFVWYGIESTIQRR